MPNTIHRYQVNWTTGKTFSDVSYTFSATNPNFVSGSESLSFTSDTAIGWAATDLIENCLAPGLDVPYADIEYTVVTEASGYIIVDVEFKGAFSNLPVAETSFEGEGLQSHTVTITETIGGADAEYGRITLHTGSATNGFFSLQNDATTISVNVYSDEYENVWLSPFEIQSAFDFSFGENVFEVTQPISQTQVTIQAINTGFQDWSIPYNYTNGEPNINTIIAGSSGETEQQEFYFTPALSEAINAAEGTWRCFDTDLAEDADYLAIESAINSYYGSGATGVSGGPGYEMSPWVVGWTNRGNFPDVSVTSGNLYWLEVSVSCSVLQVGSEDNNSYFHSHRAAT